MSILDDYEEIDLSDSYFAKPKKHKVKQRQSPKIPSLKDVSLLTYDAESFFSPSSKKKCISPQTLNHTIDRLYFKKQLSENRIQFLRGQHEFKEMQKCPFSPSINNSKRLNKKKVPGIKFRQKLRADVHTRLYMDSKINKVHLSNEEHECTFSPGISPKARAIKSPKNVSDKLFADAIKRQMRFLCTKHKTKK